MSNIPPEKPNVPNREWKEIKVNDIRIKDIIYTNSTKVLVHFAYVTKVEEGKVFGYWTDDFNKITMKSLRKKLPLNHFNMDAELGQWYRLEVTEDEDDEMDFDEPPFNVKIVVK